ncbi:indolepyruvate oxidoreductase subunit beta [Patescibacteria group bacterium]|nr:indolepyruvate oxidoreductase subunit beta [Patescibacteria group bacterium]
MPKMRNNKNKEFNMVIAGTGGQGLITLLRIVAEAALEEGQDLKTSELHGLSQRGGSVGVHIRFGRKIYSPLISSGKADLVLSLELQEALRALDYSHTKTAFLINNFLIPIPFQKPVLEKEILKTLQKFSQNIVLIPASQICQEKLEAKVLAGVYLLSLASFKNLIPLKPDSIKFALKKIVPEKYLEMNLKAFELASK